MTDIFECRIYIHSILRTLYLRKGFDINGRNTEIQHVFDTLPYRGQWPAYHAYLMPRLLMPWRRFGPGHQQL